MESISNNKRIARNSIFLSIRMLIMMAISLYTSRIILRVLGIEDFGIYNVVGGVVGTLSFMNGALSGATQRFITFAIGKGDKKEIHQVFCMGVQVHILLALLILVLAETIGLWFLCTQMSIPTDRYTASLWIYQFSIAACMLTIISIPYNAIIISFERMNVFAYISIFEAVSKLVIVYCLMFIDLDKLIVYSVLIFFVQCFIRILYGVYCHRYLPETKFKIVKNKELFLSMNKFAGWSMFGNLAYVMMTQGLNILLNIFYGPSVNAARGIAVQVQGVLMNFAANVQTAINPQITKSYANKDLVYMHVLIESSSKYACYLLLLLSMPIFICAEYVLKLWLGDVPYHTASFLRFIIAMTFIDALSNPLIVGSQATGCLRKYQTYTGTILLLTLPLSYVALKIGGSPESVFLVQLIIYLIAHTMRLYVVRPLIGLNISSYIRQVIFKVLMITFLSSIIPSILSFSNLEGFDGLVTMTLCCEGSIVFFVWTIGLKKEEKIFFYRILKQLRRDD